VGYLYKIKEAETETDHRLTNGMEQKAIAESEPRLRRKPGHQMAGLIREIVQGVDLAVKEIVQKVVERAREVNDLAQEVKSLAQEVEDLAQEVEDLAREVKSLAQEVKDLAREVKGLTQEVENPDLAVAAVVAVDPLPLVEMCQNHSPEVSLKKKLRILH
jgi:cell shape-determining protein MreC